MISDALGSLGGVLRANKNRAGVPVRERLVAVAAWGQHHCCSGGDRSAGHRRCSLFGIANQLLAGIAPRHHRRRHQEGATERWAWIPGIPLLWDLAVTLTASWLLADQLLSAATQHAHDAAARHAGEDRVRLGHQRDEINDIVRNTRAPCRSMASWSVVVLVPDLSPAESPSGAESNSRTAYRWPRRSGAVDVDSRPLA